jgi:hypothetical protein
MNFCSKLPATFPRLTSAARSAILFIRDLHVLRSSSVLKMLSRQFVEDRALNAHELLSRSRAY